MIVLAGLLMGAVLGALVARKYGGKPLDLLQYAAGFAIAFALLGLFITVFLTRI
ncbi:hypothetical protein SAMN05216227_100615 [Pseudorhodobacter antarcticus]|jgi:F0F1-type ATP synthase assembly protein I|uniref:PEP-CTERM protein-sorting domain-containing protein n=1 Tax=Pseudorhodobacter antarcticus TaxID=1077947 RepID=A0A1H8CZT4_9RHOB|nr:hypothetical protein [Pseudorhodobacter antarcticus]SEN00506.1 hypothetical protein SAMN05216227_100615 [Pseudorhodobacter antarcticus]